ncbi:hypothetical protein OG875_29455 [Streptomyces sp. NBC_01498]|uniref:hypothetical protein n=1 Tax=Streptomyces sp. NBC_01498 TaxID=2975870 RepID=UPI002E7C2EB3|nr:hypothetical protein [Streptomyces sp. NBC_01498]WTL28349.1 hypothetical protein OG875_29455 [Streptomyces sp. NBC_01498]
MTAEGNTGTNAGGSTEGSGGFAAATGDGPPPHVPPEVRAAEVRVAFAGLSQIRRLTNSAAADPGAVPADWERNQPVRAVALALEAAGVAPSALDGEGRRTATGYRVAAGERPGTVRVEWLGPHGSGAAREEERELTACAAVLTRLGWEALLYRGPRRRRFLEVEPA